MSDEIYERIRAVAIVVLLVAIAHAAGCKSAPVAPYNATVAQINDILADLKKEPVKYAVQIKTLEASKKEIITLSAENAETSQWSGAAKGAIAVGGFILVMSLLAGLKKVLG